jgi:hypothetical protein
LSNCISEFFENLFRQDLLSKFSMEESFIRVTAILIDRFGVGLIPFELTDNTQESSQKCLFEQSRVECAEDKSHLGDFKEISHKILAKKSIDIQEICSRRGYWPNDERTLSASPTLSVSRDMMLIPTSLFVWLNGFDPLTSRPEGSDFRLRAQAQAHVTTISSGAAIDASLLAHYTTVNTTPDYTSKLFGPLKMSKYEWEALREYSLRWREVERQRKAANYLTSAKLTWAIHCDGSQGLEAATILQTLYQ